MTQTKHIYISPVGEGELPTELVIREGAAAPVILPNKLELHGDYTAVMEWLRVNKSTLDKHVAVFSYDSNVMSLDVNTKPQFEDSIIVSATLRHNRELEAFGINKEKFYSKKDLEKLVKMNRFFFKNADENAKLLIALSKLNLKVEALINDEKDKRGNTNQGYSQNVTSDMPLDFTMSIPIYQGLPNSTFRVEICFDVTDRSIRFWLESVELKELQMDLADQIFKPQIESIRADGFVVICD